MGMAPSLRSSSAGPRLYGFHAGPESSPGLWVIRVCLLPSAFMMKISLPPSVRELYAIPLPSGDQDGSSSTIAWVSCARCDPSAFTV